MRVEEERARGDYKHWGLCWFCGSSSLFVGLRHLFKLPVVVSARALGVWKVPEANIELTICVQHSEARVTARWDTS